MTDNAATGFLGAGGGAFTDGFTWVRLVSVDTDWGSGATDNSPDDFSIQESGLSYSWAGVASFECDSNGC